MDKESLAYAQACQKIIDLQEKDTLPVEEACERLVALPTSAPLHPMLRWVETYARDIFYASDENQDVESYWVDLKLFIRDYLAGNWRTTTWTLSAAYRKDDHGYSLNIRRGFNRMKVEVANKRLRKLLKQVVSKLNNWQADERLLQNVALVMPREIEGYRLTHVEIFEEIA